MDIFNPKSAIEKQEDRNKEYLENCYAVRDLITFSKETRKLYKILCEGQKASQAIVMADMGKGTKIDEEGHEVPFENRDFWKCAGVIEGLGSMELETGRMINKANQDEKERKDGEKNNEK